MSNTVKPTGPVSEISLEVQSELRAAPKAKEADKPAAQTQPPSPLNPADQAQFRLIIEEDQATGAFVYKKLDRTTGEVVLQFPREEMLKLMQQSDYEAGAVIRTTA